MADATMDGAGGAPQATEAEDAGGRLMAADGTPLKKRLAQALFRTRMRALGLTAPLIAFIFLFFFLPIAYLLFQGVYNDRFEEGMPRTTVLLQDWQHPELPDEEVYAAVVADLLEAREIDRALPTRVGARVNREFSGATSTFKKTTRRARGMEAPFKQKLIDTDKDWGDPAFWAAMKRASNSYTASFVLKSLDMRFADDGGIRQIDEVLRIHVKLFLRTLEISALVTAFTLILGYPVAWLLAHLPARSANLLMIMVLLPFWTSILVRTTAWIAILQGQGVLNDIFVWTGIAADDARFSLIYNKTGTLIAMTHILLPFMILPMFSVMKTIPPSFMRAAQSLGATPLIAFIRVYLPQTIPGVGAGCLLVFILAVGYYITPALVGGETGQMISNLIAFHMQRSLDWAFAGALGAILLAGVLVLYWLFNKVVGIDKLKLG